MRHLRARTSRVERGKAPIEAGRRRIVIGGVKPEIDCGRFPIKRIIGDEVAVEADIFADGHNTLNALLLYRKETESRWTEVPMQFLVNDRWGASFKVAESSGRREELNRFVEANPVVENYACFRAAGERLGTNWRSWLQPQNIPGTCEEYPNWRRKARHSLETFSQMSEVNDIMREVNALRKAQKD